MPDSPEIIRPHWRFPFGDTVYEWHGHVGGVDALLIKDKANLTPVALYAGVLVGEPYAIVALVFLAKRQAGERVTWDEVVAQFEGDDDLFGFPQRVTNLETNPDPVRDAVPVTTAAWDARAEQLYQDFREGGADKADARVGSSDSADQ